MLTLAEIGPGIYGAWRLAHFDPDGMRFFDRSIRGFWRSFYVAVLAAPLWIIILAVQISQSHIGGGWARLVIAESIAYIVGWVAYPLAAFYLTRLIDREQQYVGFIVALNWGTLLQLAVMVPAHIIAGFNLLPVGLGMLIFYGALVATMVYEWFITRTAIGLSGLAAASFVLIDIVITVLVDWISQAEAYIS
jgi:hypothetical protein